MKFNKGDRVEMTEVTGYTVTYGRTKLLQEVLGCFVRQDYAGPHELLIVNTFPWQKLICDVPNVAVWNCETRPETLGAARNLAVEMIHGGLGGVCFCLDDDDLFLPHHFRMVADAFSKNDVDWIRFYPSFYSENYKILRTFNTWINSVCWKTSAWEKVKGYEPSLSVGEDKNLFSKLSQQCSGISVELKPQEISEIYSWGQGAYHLSGMGWDEKGKTPAYERARLDLEGRVQRGLEPTGEIELKPTMEHDPVRMVKEYLDRISVKKKEGDAVCVVELGRYGDIVNILPICRRIYETYGTPSLMVSKEFSDILDGVSYVNPAVVPLTNSQLRQALALAGKNFKHVICTQIWGEGWTQQRTCASFNRESWKQGGFEYMFNSHDPEWLPYFDRRDLDRESLLVKKLKATGKPLLLVNTTHSTSSPFPHGAEVLSFIRNEFSKEYEVVDMGTMRFERFYDVLGIMENAAALVSIDTALLHLAAGTGIPTVALVNDKPWLGSEPRGNCVSRIPYTSVTGSISNIIADIYVALALSNNSIPHRPLGISPMRTIYHVTERHEIKDAKERKRKEPAWASWDELYENGVIPSHYWNYKRTSIEIGDHRILPYMKDCLEHAMKEAGDEDIIMLTNDDNVLHPELPGIVQLHCSLWDVCCSQRCEMVGDEARLSESPKVWASKGRLHMGRDLFAFKKSWLTKHWNDIGDFILGASDWDLAMASLLRFQWGINSSRQNLEDSIWPCELPRGYVAHQSHDPKWAHTDNCNTAPSQIHNRSLFKAWAMIHLPTLQFSEYMTI